MLAADRVTPSMTTDGMADPDRDRGRSDRRDARAIRLTSRADPATTASGVDGLRGRDPERSARQRPAGDVDDAPALIPLPPMSIPIAIRSARSSGPRRLRSS